MRFPVYLRCVYEQHGQRHATYQALGNLELTVAAADQLRRLPMPVGDGFDLVVFGHTERDAKFSEVLA